MNSGNGIKPSLRTSMSSESCSCRRNVSFPCVFYYLLGLTAAPSPNRRKLKMSQCESQPNISTSPPQLPWHLIPQQAATRLRTTWAKFPIRSDVRGGCLTHEVWSELQPQLLYVVLMCHFTVMTDTSRLLVSATRTSGGKAIIHSIMLLCLIRSLLHVAVFSYSIWTIQRVGEYCSRVITKAHFRG